MNHSCGLNRTGGCKPAIEHMLHVSDHFAGGYIPIGGASAFAAAMIPLIEAGGGAVVTQADVSQVLLSSDNKTVLGIKLANGQEITSNTVGMQANKTIGWAVCAGFIGAVNVTLQPTPNATRTRSFSRWI